MEEEMKNTIKVVTICLMATGVALAAKQPNVSANDIHPVENVKCLEIRSYDNNPNNKNTYHRWIRHVTWCSEPISNIDPAVFKKFRTAKPMRTKGSNIGGKHPGRLINGFMIDKNNKVWRMDEVKDVITQLGEIDTPAEARLILWIHGYTNGNYYYKRAKGYEITYTYETTESSQHSQCVDHKEITEKALVNKKGKIVSRKKLKSKFMSQECAVSENAR
jgi:hypothetical protein